MPQLPLKTFGRLAAPGLVAVLAACSGSDDGPTPEDTPPVTAPQPGPGASEPAAPPQTPPDTDPAPQPPEPEPEPQPGLPDPLPVQPAPAPGTVAMFVGTGHVGRTTISCDGGHSWVADRSNDDTVQCFRNGVNCDESRLRGMGVAFGAGAFVATWGWGSPDGLYRSTDGVTWTRVLAGTTMAGVEFRNNRFVAVDGARVQFSDDAGLTWQRGSARGDEAPSDQIVRGMGSTGIPEATFFAVARQNQQGGPQKMKFSADGLTWKRPAQFPDALCTGGDHPLGVAEHQGIVVLASDTGVCRSADRAQTWTRIALPGRVTGRVLSDGTRFIAWGRDTGNRPAAFTSPDGLSWTATPTQLRDAGGSTRAGPSNPLDLAVAFGGGTFVAVANSTSFPPNYDDQQFLRSSDGITWDVLPAGSFRKGHPMRFIAFGEGQASSACPAR